MTSSVIGKFLLGIALALTILPLPVDKGDTSAYAEGLTATSTALTGPTSSMAGVAAYLSATVTDAPYQTINYGFPMNYYLGSVAFVEDGVTLDTVSLSLSPTATFNVSELSEGDHTVTAVYSGVEGSAEGSASDSFTFTITPLDRGLWESLGAEGYTLTGSADSFQLVLGADETPYVAFRDLGSLKVNVLKFDGEEWVSIFDSISENGLYISLITAPNGKLYLSYLSYNNSFQVKTYDPTSGEWESLSSDGIPYPNLSSNSLTIGSDGTPYLSYIHTGFNYTTYGYTSKTEVRRFDGSEWVLVGDEHGVYEGDLYYSSLAVGPEDRLYFGYRDKELKVKLKTYDDTSDSWELVDGIEDFLPNKVSYLAPISVSTANGAIYMAYTNYDSPSYSEIAKFDGTEWSQPGSFDTVGSSENISVRLGADDTLYAVVKSNADQQSYVEKYQDDEWSIIGDNSFAINTVSLARLAIGTDNQPYVAYFESASPLFMQASTIGAGTPQPSNTYTIEPIANQTANPLSVGYTSGMQEEKYITLTRTGTGDLTNLTVALSGQNAEDFVVAPPEATALDDAAPSTWFTVRAADGLSAGTYTATITVSADHMTSVSFTVTQVVRSLKGDINHDGLVTPADALYITKYMQGKIDLTDEQFEVLDMNGDGELNSEDVQMIMNIYLGVSI
ncbi:dockerin type I domain-containing protein [Cohnella fermenti]|uniref:Dockerin domain-containing protein n=1 Tax=Cohnella fermenti TaxID=2565925 RepID=A0A4S4BPE2_9BACL|nr:dockerin type I domain-containing protein [Cohnella fermenti]THF76232.1 hypothetical protein E6C55_19590 [Cohnella fermenti]